MIKNPEFDDIRPYYEDEIPAAMKRIAECDAFPLLSSFIYPNESIDSVRERVRSFKTVREFQHDTMFRVNEQIIARSMTDFSVSGLELLSPTENYLYVSNHRDIMLDASLLQYYLVLKGFETTEITFGANLMMNPVVIDIGKSNKMFKVERPGGDIKEFYRSSLHLSSYIRYAINEKKQSVWIAQRNGRTKNGIDTTDQGIIKMFCMSEPKDKIKALADLHIVPISIKPISITELSAFDNLTNNEYHKSVAKLIDSRINAAYRLYPNNYIAHDILYGNTKYKDKYTDEEYNAFMKHLSALDRYDTCDLDCLKEIFISIYSNPIDNI